MADLEIRPGLVIPEVEIDTTAIRAQGPGWQNVNKVSSAVQLRYDIANASLPEVYRERLLAMRDRRISSEGVLVIKAQRYRTREKNLDDALQRLRDLVTRALHVPKARKATRPTKASQKRRLDSKTRHGRLKSLRGKIEE